MAVVTVNPGVCGFATRIVATANEDYEVSVTITSGCEHIKQLAEQITTHSPLREMRLPMAATTVYQAAGPCKLHASCPVPSAILKAVEVAAGLALPADVMMTITRDD